MVNPNSNLPNSEWRSINVSSNSNKPITRVQPNVNINKNVNNNNQNNIQSNLKDNNFPSSTNIKPKSVTESQGQGKVVDFRQQLNTTKKKK